MPFTASVTNKVWDSGRLQVTVTYTDGERSFPETMTSRSGQTADWVRKEATRRLTELNDLDALNAAITPGPVDPFRRDVQPLTPRDVYASNLRTFTAWLDALRQGLTTVSRPAFVALRQWLRDNWLDEYVDMFLR